MLQDTALRRSGRDGALEWIAMPATVDTGEVGVLRELGPARKLFARVIEVAVEDLRYLEETRKKSKLSARDLKRLRKITEGGHPEDFFNSTWFEEVCALAGIHPGLIRDRL